MPKATLTDITKRIDIKENRSEGILSYDVDNNYPARVREIAAASGMGSSCLKLYKKFIYGRGFQNIEFAKKTINSSGLTPDKLLEKIKEDFGDCGGIFIHVNYNANYEISEINYQPLTKVRITSKENKEHPDVFVVFNNWEERFDAKKAIYINRFNPDPIEIQKQVDKVGGWSNYNGQLYFYSNRTGKYPIAVFDSVLEDMQTDAESKLYKFRNVTTNFMASHLLIIDPIDGGGDGTGGKDDDGKEKSTLSTDLEVYQGADNAQKLAIIEKDSVDQKIELQKVDQQNGDRLFEWTETSTRNNIRQVFLIPPVLLMELSGRIGGTSDEIIDATKSYNSTTEDERLVIEQIMLEIFSIYHDKSINPDGNYSIIPREAISKDDTQKKRDIQALLKETTYTLEQKFTMLVTMYSVPEEDAQKLVYPTDAIANKQTLAGKLGIGGTQSLVQTVSNPELSVEQKRGILEAVFGLPKDQIDLIVPLTKTILPATP